MKGGIAKFGPPCMYVCQYSTVCRAQYWYGSYDRLSFCLSVCHSL